MDYRGYHYYEGVYVFNMSIARTKDVEIKIKKTNIDEDKNKKVIFSIFSL